MAMILVAEDNDVLRLAICEQLKRIGMEVHEASTGLEAVEHAKGGCCRVILIDVMMPGMTGLEAIELIRQQNNQENIIVMTAGETTREEALKAGADDFIRKPILRDQLDYVVRQYAIHL
jgi:CheY-like chemotaxis protein